MSISGILQSEFLKTKRSAVRRIAIASPLCLALLATIQQGYYSLNLFNWFYVIFLPATFALMSASAVNLDNKKHGLRTIRSLPILQQSIWGAKLFIVAGYALLSCLLLSVAVVVIPSALGVLGVNQIKPLSISVIFLGIVVMFLTSMWQIPLCFLLAKRLGLAVTVMTNLFISFSGVLVALKPFWFLCPWAWVNRCMVSIIGVLPNGLPVEHTGYTGPYDVLYALLLSLGLTAVLSVLSTMRFAISEAR